MSNNKKILLAAGVFYPDVGGPAIHVAKIAERLYKDGFEPVVVCYGDNQENKQFLFKVKRISRKHSKLLQWLLYFFAVLKESIDSRVIYAFDPTAAGIPACVTSYILSKPFIIRIGGDPIWEREAEMGRRVMPIVNYYEKGLYKKDKPILFKIIKLLLKNADVVVFYNQFWKEFYNKYYSLPLEKVRIVKNPIFKREKASSELGQNPQIIFAGRFVTYKNLPLVLNAFNNIREKLGKGRLLLIGKGPEINKLLDLKKSLNCRQHIEFLESLPQEKLFEEVRKSAIAIGPALSEFNPNFILESLSFGKPVILSKGHGLSIDLPEEFLFDPLNQKELERKIEYLFNTENYRKAVDTIDSLDMSQTWEKVTDFHSGLMKEMSEITDFTNFISNLFKRNLLLRYFICGITAAAINILSLYLFVRFGGFGYLPSSVLAFLTSLLISFILQKFVVFRDKVTSKIHHQFLKFFVSAILGVITNTVIFFACFDVLGIWYIFSQIIAGFFVMFQNFILYKFFIFNKI